MNADELAQSIAEEDVKRLSSAPGIGKKTAERMVLELRGKLVSHTVSDGLFAPDAVADESQDIINTLLALGYNERRSQSCYQRHSQRYGSRRRRAPGLEKPAQNKAV